MCYFFVYFFFFFSSRRRHTRLQGDWSSDVCSSDLMKPTDSSVSEALSGLKPQVQSAPFSLEIVSVLLVDVVPPLAPEPELELEPAVQPAASIPAATMTPYLVRRLMPGPGRTGPGSRP